MIGLAKERQAPRRSVSWLTKPVAGEEWDRLLWLAGGVSLMGIVLVAFVPVVSEMALFFSLTLLLNGPYSPLLPVAYEPMIVVWGRLHQPIVIAAVGTAGATAVEVVNWHLYRAMMQSKQLGRLRESRFTCWLLRVFQRAPFLSLVISALTPIPYWVARCASTLAGYSLGRHLTATALGRLPRYWLYAALGGILVIPTGWILGGVAVVSTAILVGIVVGRRMQASRVASGCRPPEASPFPDRSAR